MLELVGRGAGPTRVLNLLLTHFRLWQVARELTVRAPQIDLKGKRVLMGPVVQHPLQGGIGHETAIPVVLALDLGSRKSRWQRATGDDVRRTDVMGPVVEVDEITRADIYCTHAEPHAVGIDAIKVNQAFKCALQRGDIVVTNGIRGFGGP